MNDVINLRRFRKDKARAEASKQADNNRLVYGRSKAERETAKAMVLQQTRRLDGHKLDDVSGAAGPQEKRARGDS